MQNEARKETREVAAQQTALLEYRLRGDEVGQALKGLLRNSLAEEVVHVVLRAQPVGLGLQICLRRGGMPTPSGGFGVESPVVSRDEARRAHRYVERKPVPGGSGGRVLGGRGLRGRVGLLGAAGMRPRQRSVWAW